MANKNLTITKAQAQKLVGTRGMDDLIHPGDSTPLMNGAACVVLLAKEGRTKVFSLEGDSKAVDELIEAISPRPMATENVGRRRDTGPTGHRFFLPQA